MLRNISWNLLYCTFVWFGISLDNQLAPIYFFFFWVTTYFFLVLKPAIFYCSRASYFVYYLYLIFHETFNSIFSYALTFICTNNWHLFFILFWNNLLFFLLKPPTGYCLRTSLFTYYCYVMFHETDCTVLFCMVWHLFLQQQHQYNFIPFGNHLHGESLTPFFYWSRASFFAYYFYLIFHETFSSIFLYALAFVSQAICTGQVLARGQSYPYLPSGLNRVSAVYRRI